MLFLIAARLLLRKARSKTSGMSMPKCAGSARKSIRIGLLTPCSSETNPA